MTNTICEIYHNLVYLNKLVDMAKNTSISLGNHFEDFVNGQVGTGRFNNASEVIRAGLRLLEERERKIEALRQAIIEGEQSGFIENYNPESHLAELHKRHGK